MNYLLSLDERTFLVFNGILGKGEALDWTIKVAAVYLIYLVPIALLILWFYSTLVRKQALHLALAGLLAWMVNKIVGTLIDRPRPSVAVLQIKEVVFHRPDYSFPSDHMALIFALAIASWQLKMKKLAVFWWILGAVVGIARISAGVHYPSDIIAGAILGTLVGWLFSLLYRPFSGLVYTPIVKLLKNVGI